MKLYEINEALAQFSIEDLIDEETGEILNKEGFDKLNELQMAKSEKEINIALIIKNKRAEAEALNVEKNKLAKREKSKLNEIDFWENYWRWSLDGERIDDARVQVTYRKGNKLDETFAKLDLIPDKYKVQKIELAKSMLKQAIKEGLVSDADLKDWGLKIDNTPSMIIK